MLGWRDALPMEETEHRFSSFNLENLILQPSNMGCRKLTYYEQEALDKTAVFSGDARGKTGNAEKKRVNYYPYGMPMVGRNTNLSDYRFGMNGMEMDNELSGNGNSYTTEFRQYDPRLGRWLSIDPVIHPGQSPYVAFNNNPVFFIDPEGTEGVEGIKDVKDPGGGTHKVDTKAKVSGDKMNIEAADGKNFSYEGADVGYINESVAGGVEITGEAPAPADAPVAKADLPNPAQTGVDIARTAVTVAKMVDPINEVSAQNTKFSKAVSNIAGLGDFIDAADFITSGREGHPIYDSDPFKVWPVIPASSMFDNSGILDIDDDVSWMIANESFSNFTDYAEDNHLPVLFVYTSEEVYDVGTQVEKTAHFTDRFAPEAGSEQSTKHVYWGVPAEGDESKVNILGRFDYE